MRTTTIPNEAAFKMIENILVVEKSQFWVILLLELLWLEFFGELGVIDVLGNDAQEGRGVQVDIQ